MNEYTLVSTIALVGWLILVLGAYRSHKVDASKTIRMALIWAVIFTGLAIFFTVVM